ncbi:SDR family oxidoreductase [Hymenobacter lapidiphilus]|uniref:SDR family oxidoreductase n=1 Tax=Hymenobacter sp. CCM 8763 TaxID=2303334 RepID=UPI001F5B769F|nr:SDR family oxidoreductase [Hymenobacter sp. CCM 8763]
MLRQAQCDGNGVYITVEQFAQAFQLNVFSTWRLCQLCAPHMAAAGYGSVINILSMASINHTTRNLAFDFGPVVHVNAIGPGAVRTGALATVLTPEIEKRMLAHTPLQRLGKVDDIAGAVLHFSSPVAAWVSGQVLFVNGGSEQTPD